jgi:hypothetical protein
MRGAVAGMETVKDSGGAAVDGSTEDRTRSCAQASMPEEAARVGR